MLKSRHDLTGIGYARPGESKLKVIPLLSAEGLFVQAAGAEERRKSIFRNSKGCFVYSDTRKKLLTTVFKGGIFFTQIENIKFI